MKYPSKKCRRCLGTALGGAMQLAAGASPQAADLTVDVTGMVSDVGNARIILVDSEAAYRGEAPPKATIEAEIHGGKATVTIRDQAPGKYALIAHHDTQPNGELDRPVFGLPVEPYGFSNGAWTSFGVPDWEKTRFAISTDAARQRIDMRMNVFAAALIALKAGAPALALIIGGIGGIALARRLRRQNHGKSEIL